MAIDIHEQKKVLGEALKEITNELKTLGIHNPNVREDWIAIPAEPSDDEADPNLAADRVEDWDQRRATLAVLETRYNNITRALKKIEDNTYGTCEIGNEPIEDERLKINPTARTCMKHTDEEASLTL